MLAIGETFDVFFCIFVVCELGQGVTDLFTSIADVIEQFDWYLHSIAMKKMLLTILPITQKPVYLKCFGSIAANRDACKNVSVANKLPIRNTS